MNTTEKSPSGNGKTGGPEKLLNDMSRAAGKELNSLEQAVIASVYKKYAGQANNRFLIDEDMDMLAEETDENSGVIGLTDDYACVFKIGPVFSATPGDMAPLYSRKAGMMNREIFVRGAQPLATLLSFSSDIPGNASMQAEMKNAVKNISLYNNVYGIPMVGGCAGFGRFNSPAMTADMLAVGLCDKEERLFRAGIEEGDILYLVGWQEKDDSIQAGAFAERTLYELVCDLYETNMVKSVRNIGSNGIIGACVDMVNGSMNGLELKADTLIPASDHAESLLEYISNRVMIVINHKDRKNFERTCKKWYKSCEPVGVVIPDRFIIKHGESVICDLPSDILSRITENLPRQNPVEFNSELSGNYPSPEVPEPEDYRELAKFMMTCPNLLSQGWLFDQFDSTVGTNNLSTNFISDTPVLQIKGARHALGISFCHSTVNLQEYPEAVNLTLAESIRQVICSGGAPRLLTGCLNYSGALDEKTGNNIKKINEYIAFACKKTGVCSSGIKINQVNQEGASGIHNVSIGAIAFLNDKHQQMTMSFKNKGDMIYMLGKSADNLNASEYLRAYHDLYDTPPPPFDVDAEVKLLHVAQKVIARKLVKSAHSVSVGGLFMALLQSAMVRSFGFDITVDDEIRKDAFLFGESPSRIVVSVATAREADFIDFMMEAEMPFLSLGHVTREEIRIDDNSFGFISDYKKRYEGTVN